MIQKDSGKSSTRLYRAKKSGDILLKDKGTKVAKENVAQFINDYFINIGNFKLPDPGPGPSDSVSSINTEAEMEGIPSLPVMNAVNKEEVLKIVKEINVSKSSGLEDIGSFVVKEAFTVLIAEVTYMYNLSISSAHFPDAWKQVTIIPLPKTGNLTMVKNYGPISLLPLPGKILEKLIHHQLSNFLEVDFLLDNNQHGFRKQHSTIHSVAQLTDYVSKKMDYLPS